MCMLGDSSLLNTFSVSSWNFLHTPICSFPGHIIQKTAANPYGTAHSPITLLKKKKKDTYTFWRKPLPFQLVRKALFGYSLDPWKSTLKFRITDLKKFKKLILCQQTHRIKVVGVSYSKILTLQEKLRSEGIDIFNYNT